MAGAEILVKTITCTPTDGAPFILPSSFSVPSLSCSPAQSCANPPHDAITGQSDDHCERLPETGAKRPFKGADETEMEVGGAAVAKLPDASVAASPRTANSWL